MAGSKVATSRSILYYDPDRTDYAVTETELQRLEEGGGTAWKDVCLVSVSVFVTSAPNVVGALWGQGPFTLTLSLFLNSLAAGISLVASVAFGLAWKRASRAQRLLLKQIRNKPRVILRTENLEFEAEARQEESIVVS